LAKLTDFTKFQTPTGATGNLLSPQSWLSLILGTVMLLATFAIGQNVSKRVSERIPAVDTTIDPIISQPIMGNRKEVY
jgi:hypothetical protein